MILQDKTHTHTLNFNTLTLDSVFKSLTRMQRAVSTNKSRRYSPVALILQVRASARRLIAVNTSHKTQIKQSDSRERNCVQSSTKPADLHTLRRMDKAAGSPINLPGTCNPKSLSHTVINTHTHTQLIAGKTLSNGK